MSSFAFDGTARQKLQNYVVSKRKLPVPKFTRLPPYGSTVLYVVQVQVGTLGMWHGRGHSRVTAESSASIAALMALGQCPAQEQLAAVQPVPPKRVPETPVNLDDDEDEVESLGKMQRQRNRFDSEMQEEANELLQSVTKKHRVRVGAEALDGGGKSSNKKHDKSSSPPASDDDAEVHARHIVMRCSRDESDDC